MYIFQEAVLLSWAKHTQQSIFRFFMLQLQLLVANRRYSICNFLVQCTFSLTLEIGNKFMRPCLYDLFFFLFRKNEFLFV